MISTILRSFSIFFISIFCLFFLGAFTNSEGKIATPSSTLLKKDNSIKKEKKQFLEIIDKKEEVKSTRRKNRFQILKKVYKLHKAVKKSKQFKNKKGKSKSPRFLAVLGLIFSGIGFFVIASLAFVALSSIALFISLAIFLIFLSLITGENYFDFELSEKVVTRIKITISFAATFGLVGLVLSIIALRKLNKSEDLVDRNGYTADQHEKKKHQDGTRIFAIAGIVLGIIALFSILVLFMI